MLNDKDKPETTVYEIDASIGLEKTKSFNPITEMKELWPKTILMRQPDFGLTMSRNIFESIRARFQIHAPDSVPVERREQDPLWHSPHPMRQIQEQFASIAVPVGIVNLDENCCRLEGFIRIFRVGRWIWRQDEIVTCGEVCGRLSSTQSTPMTVGRADISIARKDPSALWVAMCSHLTKTHAAPNGHRLLVPDKFYTRHVLGKTHIEFTGSEMKKIGTVRISLQGKWTGVELKARMDKVERGTWELVVAVDVPTEWQKLKEKHTRLQKNPSHLQTEYAPSLAIAANARYIGFCDKFTVIFIQTIWLERRPRECCLANCPWRFSFAAVLHLFNVGLSGSIEKYQSKSTEREAASNEYSYLDIRFGANQCFFAIQESGGSSCSSRKYTRFQTHRGRKLTSVQREHDWKQSGAVNLKQIPKSNPYKI
ncbi:LOW QUALITY PROTEIN: hypothetical protein PHMEG_0007339 [Phytophthora megakarya]|uniref:Uncharacterized protein n=1 Tax=Phytophthora megakarya TaxID=4795 RepID=A0A225WLJ2_9STRA|nr:LOW QUALITY PROTEIN: hypothetical protein PHMEG_0007339 [Phytophthora megakarya]